MAQASNTYSERWFNVFGSTVAADEIALQTRFIATQIPLAKFRCVLDVCCGVGRHAHELARHGYHVVGLDRSASAIEAASQRSHTNLRFVQQDVRQLDEFENGFDGVLCLWQSFGYFDEVTNTEVLRQMSRRLRAEGRMVLDVYRREFFEGRDGSRLLQRPGSRVREIKRMKGNRLQVTLQYEDGIADYFDWRLYDESEWRDLFDCAGLKPLLVCSGFDISIPATAQAPRQQWVVEKLPPKD